MANVCLYFHTQLSHDGITHCVYSCSRRISDDGRENTGLASCTNASLESHPKICDHITGMTTDEPFVSVSVNIL